MSAALAGSAVVLGSKTVPGQACQVRPAREFVSRVLAGHPCRWDAALLVSELVTNSVCHSHSACEGETITVTVIALPGRIRVEVIDAGGKTVPALHLPPDDLAETGRGLYLVAQMSADWGFYQDEAGTVVWFEVAQLCACPGRLPRIPLGAAGLPGTRRVVQAHSRPPSCH
jgi:anti-sigma regulatory factor (Ser/Thr protein kinase)